MPDFRSLLCATLALIALVPFAVRANDSSIDTGFNPFAIDPGWRRAYDSIQPTGNQISAAAALAPDGGYVLAGSISGISGSVSIFLAKLRPNGDYDSSFGGTPGTGNAGSGRVLNNANFTSVIDMTIDAQGRIVVVGAMEDALGQSDFGVARFNPNGSVDTSFSGDGRTVIGFDLDLAHERTNDVPQSVTTASDGSVYVAGLIQAATSGGTETVRVGVAKLMPDGSNTSTGYGTLSFGRQVFCEVDCDHVYSVARIVYDATRNRLIIGGDRKYNNSDFDFDWFIVAQDLGAAGMVLTRNFSIDQGGNSGQQNDFMSHLAVQADGKVTALGYAYTDFGNFVPVVLRLMPDIVNEDSSFGNVSGRGLSLIDSTPLTYFWSFAADSSGRLVIVGQNLQYFWGAAIRLLPNGALDSSFSGSTSTSGYFAGTSSGNESAYSTSFRHIFLDGNRPVLVGEAPDSHTENTDYDLIITRLQSDRIFANGFQ